MASLTLKRVPRIKPRRRYSPALPGYMESDRDWVENNMRACVAFLEAALEAQT